MEQTGKNILIVDDDPRNIFALKAVLKAKGYNCLTLNAANEVIPALKSDTGIGIVLLDMMMPEMDGYEVLKQIRSDEQVAAVPVIAVTAQAMAGDKEKCLDAGANDYVAKPINADLLISYLNKYLKD